MPPDLAILVTGDRWWPSPKAIGTVLRREPPFVLIHGDARGADKLAGAAATRMMMPVEAFPALWDREGRAAGPIRNTRMLRRLMEHRDEGLEVKAIAFHNDLSSSRGTKNMIEQLKRAEVPVKLVRQKPVVLNLRSHADHRLDGELPYARVDRKTKYGNPWSHLPSANAARWHVSSRVEAVETYRTWAWSNDELIAAARAELRGRNLACWCTPQLCHASVLLEIANAA